MKKSRTLDGINIQFPISSLILSGQKTVETRTYPIPEKYLGKDLILIETPGPKGAFKARMRAVIRFTSCYKYDSESHFYSEEEKHCVTRKSAWAYDSSKGKWGWVTEVIEIFESPLPLRKRTGIIYSKNLTI